jgi:hypothetical protein
MPTNKFFPVLARLSKCVVAAWDRYPVVRIVGVACFLACFILAACLTGYPYRLTPLGGFLAGIFPGRVPFPLPQSQRTLFSPEGSKQWSSFDYFIAQAHGNLFSISCR